MKKILIVGPSWVGDMVMSQSLYITLKQLHPDSIIDVLAPAWCKPVLERMPEVNSALEMPIGHGEFNFSQRRKMGIQLRNKQYDEAYICPNSAKSALIPFFAKIPKRIGWRGEWRYGLLNDLRPNKKSFQYMVERYVALAYPKSEMVNSSSLGGLENLARPKLTIDTALQQQTLTKFALDISAPVIGLCPGAEFGPAKKWPEKSYAEVAEHAAKNGKQVWLFGSQKDIETCEIIKSHVSTEYQDKLHILAGQTSLIEAVDLLAACQTVVSNDSGLMHVAAAVGCHVIGVYGSTSPKYTPPLADKLDIVSIDLECRPCFKRECPLGHLKCLKELNSESVVTLL
jgi:heptosyltransferase-2